MEKATITAPKKTGLRAIPKGVWALGLVSLFMDTSSEMIHSLLPIFMVTTLGASMAAMGLVEGIAEATALIVKIFSGTLSDFFGKRKPLTLLGYGLAALSKPLFPMAASLGIVVTARFLDRIGKGIRGAPRDALMSELSPPTIRGACYGLRQTLDTVGAFLGPALALLCLSPFAYILYDKLHIHTDVIRIAFWVAVIPALLSVLFLAFGVKEPAAPMDSAKKPPLCLKDIRHIGKAFWVLVALCGVLNLAHFSEAFLLLKAQGAGLPIAYVPMVLIVMNIVYALAAYPAGALSDKMPRQSVLMIGLLFLIGADIVLGLASNIWIVFAGVALWGLYLGFTQGLLAAMVADTTPARLRGTAYGVFNLVSGLALLVSNIGAGFLWDSINPAAPFYAGAGLTVVAIGGIAVMGRRKKH